MSTIQCKLILNNSQTIEIKPSDDSLNNANENNTDTTTQLANLVTQLDSVAKQTNEQLSVMVEEKRNGNFFRDKKKPLKTSFIFPIYVKIYYSDYYLNNSKEIVLFIKLFRKQTKETRGMNKCDLKKIYISMLSNNIY